VKLCEDLCVALWLKNQTGHLMTNIDGSKIMPSVAIVILNWNGQAFLEKFLPSVLNSVYKNKRIIVADNASTDDSILFIAKNYPAIEIIKNEANFGFAKGYNSALKKIDADYYVLLNNDVEVSDNWIDPVITLMESHQVIAACQPKILSWHDKTMFEYAGAAGGWIDNFGYPFMRGRLFDVCEKDKGQYDTAQPCFWASGAALFVKAKAYHLMEGLDEHFFAHQEEIDLCWRLQLSGYKVFVQPASVVYHVGGGTLQTGNSRKTFLNFRNNLIMLYKNLRWQQAIWKIPVRVLLDAMAGWKGLFGGEGGYFIAILKAHIHFISWLFFGKRPLPLKRFNDADIPGLYKGCIVWDYFIKKKRTFSEIIESK
jgi:GT2 family glycosyltransferase